MTQTENTDPALTTAEACVYLGGESRPYAENTLRIWRTLGKGPKFIKGEGKNGRVRYRKSALDEYLAANTHRSTAAY